MRDPVSNRVIATVTSPFYGPKIWFADDPAGEWTQAEGVALPDGSDEALERIWVIVAGEEAGSCTPAATPACCSRAATAGRPGELNRGLARAPGQARTGSRAAAGCACTRSCPGRASRTGSRWRCRPPASGTPRTTARPGRRGNEGIVPRYLPEEAREGATQLCVHRMERAARRPERLFIQFHGGVYRSDDAGRSWTAIGDGLPSDFGFPLALDPSDPDSAYVIPLRGDFDRVMPDGHVRVYETRDGGETWTPRGDGLPGPRGLPDRAPPRLRPDRRRPAIAALFRRHVRGCVRLGRRRRKLVHRRHAPAAGVLGDGNRLGPATAGRPLEQPGHLLLGEADRRVGGDEQRGGGSGGCPRPAAVVVGIVDPRQRAARARRDGRSRRASSAPGRAARSDRTPRGGAGRPGRAPAAGSRWPSPPSPCTRPARTCSPSRRR